MCQNSPYIFFSFRVPYYIFKSYPDTKFQLIWPSNSRENKKCPLVLPTWLLFAIWRPNVLKFGVKIGFQKVIWVPKRKKKMVNFAALREKNKIWKRKNLPVFFKLVWRHLKSDCTPPWCVPTQPQWRVGRMGTHKPRGWQLKKWKKLLFWKKNHFFKRTQFFKKMTFSHFFI